MSSAMDQLQAYCGGFQNKRILDVGTDVHGNWIKEISEYAPVEEIVGIGLNIEPRRISDNVILDKKDIRNTDYEDNSFDIVLSRSAFEHIQELPRALAEIKRILKPGGILWTRFGPIWSCNYGHHLWFRHNNEIVNYWNLTLPPFCHLTMLPHELSAKLMLEHEKELTEKVIKWIYDSDGQNKLFFEDYQEIFSHTGMELLLFAGTDNSKAEEIYGPQTTPETFATLRNKYPRYKNFYSKGILAIFRK